jgi:hypothetical protein
MRKNSFANGSQDGADLQTVLLSIFRTFKQRAGANGRRSPAHLLENRPVAAVAGQSY